MLIRHYVELVESQVQRECRVTTSWRLFVGYLELFEAMLWIRKLEATRWNNIFIFGSFLKGKSCYFRENYWWNIIIWTDLFLNKYIYIYRYIHCLLYRYRKIYIYQGIHSSFYVFLFTYDVHLSLLQSFCRSAKKENVSLLLGSTFGINFCHPFVSHHECVELSRLSGGLGIFRWIDFSQRSLKYPTIFTFSLGGFKHVFISTPTWKLMIQFDLYFSNGVGTTN